jgi:membrane-associated protease RseP (regulator of RpoE activity)
VGVLAFGGEGCQRILDARDERIANEREAEHKTADTPKAIGADTAKPDAPAKSATVNDGDPALDAVLARAIVEPVGDATYRVDPFVAALAFERIRMGRGPTFTKAVTAPAGPTAGYRVGGIAADSLWAHLGLRDGDVIESINGVLLTGPERIGFALDGAENRVDVSVFRDDLSFVNSYRLNEPFAWRELLADLDPGEVVAKVAVPAVPSTPIDAGATNTPSTSGGTTPSPSTSGTAHGGGTPPTPHPSVTPSPGVTPKPGGTTPKPTPTPSGGTTPKPTGASPVACESMSRCTITRAYFDKQVGNPSALQSQANIVPAIQDDVFSGYKLKSVKAGSAVHQLGFRAGDKITHVNGQDLTDEMGAMGGLYLGLGNTSVFKIRYQRGGASLVKTVVVV